MRTIKNSFNIKHLFWQYCAIQTAYRIVKKCISQSFCTINKPQTHSIKKWCCAATKNADSPKVSAIWKGNEMWFGFAARVLFHAHKCALWTDRTQVALLKTTAILLKIELHQVSCTQRTYSNRCVFVREHKTHAIWMMLFFGKIFCSTFLVAFGLAGTLKTKNSNFMWTINLLLIVSIIILDAKERIFTGYNVVILFYFTLLFLRCSVQFNSFCVENAIVYFEDCVGCWRFHFGVEHKIRLLRQVIAACNLA